MHAVTEVLSVLSTLFVFTLRCAVLFLAVVFVLDRVQRKDAILRNYPVIGHMPKSINSLTAQAQWLQILMGDDPRFHCASQRRYSGSVSHLIARSIYQVVSFPRADPSGNTSVSLCH
jgi:uncharacterized membrane protein